MNEVTQPNQTSPTNKAPNAVMSILQVIVMGFTAYETFKVTAYLKKCQDDGIKYSKRIGFKSTNN